MALGGERAKLGDRWVRAPALREMRAAITIGDTASPPTHLSMSASSELPADLGIADFDALQEDSERWIGVVAALGARYSSAPAVPAGEGTVLVALLGRELVLKLYPPFMRDHFAFECGMLGHLQGRLSLPTPRLVDSAEHAGWPYLVMTQLPGTTLDRVWPTVSLRQVCMKSIAVLAKEA